MGVGTMSTQMGVIVLKITSGMRGGALRSDAADEQGGTTRVVSRLCCSASVAHAGFDGYHLPLI